MTFFLFLLTFTEVVLMHFPAQIRWSAQLHHMGVVGRRFMGNFYECCLSLSIVGNCCGFCWIAPWPPCPKQKKLSEPLHNKKHIQKCRRSILLTLGMVCIVFFYYKGRKLSVKQLMINVLLNCGMSVIWSQNLNLKMNLPATFGVYVPDFLWRLE